MSRGEERPGELGLAGVESRVVPTFVRGKQEGPDSEEFIAIAKGVKLGGELKRTAYEQAPFRAREVQGVIRVRYTEEQLARLNLLAERR